MFSTVSETTLRETLPPQSAPIAPSAEESRLVLGNKQIAATAFVVLTLITVIATLSYIVGRAGRESGASAETGVGNAAANVAKGAPLVPAPAAAATAPEQVIIVDPKPEAVSAVATPAAPATPAPAVTAPWNPDLAPAAGTVFFQVASVDKGMADVSVQYLQEKGFPARRAPGATAGLYRVLVGPLEAGQAMTVTESKLKDLGFTPFPKKY